MSRFRILHISDFHFCVEPNRRNWLRLFKQAPALTLRHLAAHQMTFYPASYSDEVAENAARFIYKHRGRFDIAVISGDLGTTGRAEDLMEAHGFVYAPAFKAYLSARRRPTLQGGVQLAFLLPGNHDRYRDNRGNAGCKNFELKFDQDWPGPAVRTRVLGKGDARMAIVAVDFCLRRNQDALRPTSFNRWGQGKAYDDTVEWLERETADVRRRHSPIGVLWVTHFPPAIPCRSEFRLLGDHRVLDAAERNGIKVILSGHLHQKIEHTSRGTQIFCAGSMTSCEDDESNWIHLLELDVQGDNISSCTKTDFRWNDTDAEFIQSTPSQNFMMAP